MPASIATVWVKHLSYWKVNFLAISGNRKENEGLTESEHIYLAPS